MEAAHACEDADLRRLANQVDELIVDCHSDASENWQEIDLVDEPDEIDEIAEGAQPRHPDDKIAEDQTPRKKLNYHAIKSQILDEGARETLRRAEHRTLSFSAEGLQRVIEAGQKMWTELVKHAKWLIAVVRGEHDGSRKDDDRITKNRAATLLVMVKRALQSFDGHTHISSKISLFRSLVTDGLVAESDIDEVYKAVRSLRASWALHLILQSYDVYSDHGMRGKKRAEAECKSWDNMRSKRELQFDYVAQRETIVIPGLRQVLKASSGSASAAASHLPSDGGVHVLLTLFDAGHRGMIALSSNNSPRAVQAGERDNFIAIVTDAASTKHFDRTYMPMASAGADCLDEVLQNPDFYNRLIGSPKPSLEKLFPPAESAKLTELLEKQSQSASAISWTAITQSLNTACASSYETKQVANRWNYLKTRPAHKALADKLASSICEFTEAESAALIELLEKQSQSASAISWTAITQSLNTTCASSYETKQVANRWSQMKRMKKQPQHKALADTLAGRKRASVAAAAPKRSKKQRTQRPAEPTLETVVAGPTPVRCLCNWSVCLFVSHSPCPRYDAPTN